MRVKEFKRPKKAGLIGIGLLAIFFIVVVIALPWQIWKSYAASPSSGSTANLQNVRSIWATATAEAQQGATATVNATGKNKAATATATRRKTATATAAATTTVVATATATATVIQNSDLYPLFCRSFYHIATSIQSPADKYTDCLNMAAQFQSYLQSRSFVVGSGSSKDWPAASLVALEVPSDASSTGNNVSANDAGQVEGDLTSYLQAQTNTSTGYQDALTNWINDPLLSLALVTYTFDSTTGQAHFADATNGNPSFTAVSTFVESNSSEVAKIQTDLMSSLESTTYKPTGIDCSFSASSLTQSYQNCLGADSLVDLLSDERYTSGTDLNTLYDTVMPIVENEFNGELNSYLQAQAAGTNATEARSAYAFIASLSDQKMKGALIDHLLTAVVTGQ